jgi:hypothetical protein
MEETRAREEADRHNTHIDDAEVQEWLSELSPAQLRELVDKVAKTAMVDLRKFRMEPEVKEEEAPPPATVGGGGGGGAVALSVALVDEVPPALVPVLRSALELTDNSVDPSHLHPSKFAGAVKAYLAGSGELESVVGALGPVAYDARIFESLVHLSASSGHAARSASRHLVTRFKEVLEHQSLKRIKAHPLAPDALPDGLLPETGPPLPPSATAGAAPPPPPPVIR